MAKAKSTTGRLAERREKNRLLNEEQHKNNLSTLRAEGISPRTASVKKFRTSRKGETESYVKTYDVRPSKLVRSSDRAKDGKAAAFKAAAAKSGLKPEGNYTTAEHLAAAKRKGAL